MNNDKAIGNVNKNLSVEDCSGGCAEKSMDTGLACKLTTPELRKRKEVVLSALKNILLEKKELHNGFAYRFAGDDQTIDQLTAFIKTERECCDFFSFKLIITGDKKNTWLELTGPGKMKEFIQDELEL